MDLTKLFEEILNGHRVSDWSVTLNGKVKGTVLHGAIGLTALTTVWATFTYEIEDQRHMVSANRPLAGGDTTVLLDGKAIPKGKLALSKHLVGFPPHLRIEVDIDNEGIGLRFDGTVL